MDVLKDTVSELLGRPGEKELADRIYEEIRKTDGILNAADMMLHNYGPDRYSGSVNIEMDHKKTVGQVYQIIHKLQLQIMYQYHVVMIFGIYAVDNDHEYVKDLRKVIEKFVADREHMISYHALYLEPGTNRLFCDLVVDYELKDWNAAAEEFKSYMKAYAPETEIVLTIETEYV